MRRAQLPDGTPLEFPDETTDAVIDSTVKRILAERQSGVQRQALQQDLTTLERQAQAAETPPTQERSFQERALGSLEAILNIGSGAVAEAAAGIGGIAKAVTSGPEAATRTIEQIREGLTLQPTTEAGREQVQAVGEFLQPVGEAFQKAQEFLGNTVFEKTGSPELAAAAATIPTALAEVIGFKGIKTATAARRKAREATEGKQIAVAIQEAVPSADQLFDTSRAVFAEIDELGVTIKPQAFAELTKRLSADANKAGLDPTITSNAVAALKRFESAAEIGTELTVTELDTLRKVVQGAAGSLNKTESAIGNAMLDTIDSFLDSAGVNVLNRPSGVAADIGKRYKVARDLWGRARRSELLEKAVVEARDVASGFENGIRQEFRKLLKNKKQSRFFNVEEKAAMRQVVQGTPAANLAKIFGKLAFTEGSATGFLSGSVGVFAGSQLFGAAGAVAFPVIGHISKKLSQRLTAKNAQFANEVIRAGKDAKKITAAYFKNTPQPQRSAAELAELLMKRDIDLSQLPPNEIARLAGEIAKENRVAGAAAVATGAESSEDNTQQR